MPMLSNGGKQASLTVAGQLITVKELTLQEISQWLEDKVNPPDEIIAAPLMAILPIGEMMLGDIFRMTDLTEDVANSLKPSELEAVANKCREVNRSFFTLAATVTMAGKAALDQLSTSLTEPAPS